MNKDLRENTLSLQEKIKYLEIENIELEVPKNKDTDN